MRTLPRVPVLTALCHDPWPTDPTQAASLCALTQLLTEHDDEMTELVLSGLSKPALQR